MKFSAELEVHEASTQPWRQCHLNLPLTGGKPKPCGVGVSHPGEHASRQVRSIGHSDQMN